MNISEEVIDNYLLWEICKQRENIRRIILENFPVSDERMEEIIEKVKKEYREKGYSLDEKKEKLEELDSNPDYRSRTFEQCSWRKETVRVEDLGTTLPRFGDLPPEVITGRLPQVVEFVEQADPDEYRSVEYMKELKEVPIVLNKFLPWVVTPGNRPSKLERMNKLHGEKEWSIEDTWGMINDGNHRTVAKILAKNLEEVVCYVGYRQTNG